MKTMWICAALILLAMNEFILCVSFLAGAVIMPEGDG